MYFFELPNTAIAIPIEQNSVQEFYYELNNAVAPFIQNNKRKLIVVDRNNLFDVATNLSLINTDILIYGEEIPIALNLQDYYAVVFCLPALKSILDSTYNMFVTPSQSIHNLITNINGLKHSQSYFNTFITCYNN